MEAAALYPLIIGTGMGVAASSMLAPKPSKPKIPAPTPLPKEQDLAKIEAIERKRLMKRATPTLLTSKWLGQPTLLTKKLGD